MTTDADAPAPLDQRESLHLFLRHLVSTLRDEPRSDAELLARFAADNDQNAFRAVVVRYSRSVWVACLAVLSDTHDAEDAFQATFMALARGAGSLDARNGIGPWLRTTARRAALQLRRTTSRFQTLRTKFHLLRTSAEAGSPPRADAEGPDDGTVWAQTAAELERLPARLRQAVVLYHLEGRTLAQIAEMHRCSVAVAHRRVGQALELLRKRLSARGVALTASVLCTGLPVGLVRGATASAFTFASGTGGPHRLAGLVQGLLAPSASGWVKVLGILSLLGAGTAAGLCIQPGPAAPLPPAVALSTPPLSVRAAPVPKGAGANQPATAVRVVGVYEGTRPAGAPLRAEVGPGVVTVKVGEVKKPVVLVLTSYAPVAWKVDAPKGAVVKVIASSYHKQTVEVLNETVPVTVLSYEANDKGFFFAYAKEAGPGASVWEINETKRAYERLVSRVKDLTGQGITEFQGRYTGDVFEIR